MEGRGGAVPPARAGARGAGRAGAAPPTPGLTQHLPAALRVRLLRVHPLEVAAARAVAHGGPGEPRSRLGAQLGPRRPAPARAGRVWGSGAGPPGAGPPGRGRAPLDRGPRRGPLRPRGGAGLWVPAEGCGAPRPPGSPLDSGPVSQLSPVSHLRSGDRARWGGGWRRTDAAGPAHRCSEGSPRESSLPLPAPFTQQLRRQMRCR